MPVGYFSRHNGRRVYKAFREVFRDNEKEIHVIGMSVELLYGASIRLPYCRPLEGHLNHLYNNIE